MQILHPGYYNVIEQAKVIHTLYLKVHNDYCVYNNWCRPRAGLAQRPCTATTQAEAQTYTLHVTSQALYPMSYYVQQTPRVYGVSVMDWSLKPLKTLGFEDRNQLAMKHKVFLRWPAVYSNKKNVISVPICTLVCTCRIHWKCKYTRFYIATVWPRRCSYFNDTITIN